MKHLILLLCFSSFLNVALSQSTEQDAIEKFFSEYQTNDDFTSIYISKLMFGMMADVNSEDPDGQAILDVIKDLSGLRILTSDNPPSGFYKKAHSLLKTKKYEQLMTVREEDSMVDFLILSDNSDTISELILLTGEENSVVLMSFKGNLNLNKISKLSKTLNFDGAEHLNKLKEK